MQPKNLGDSSDSKSEDPTAPRTSACISRQARTLCWLKNRFDESNQNENEANLSIDSEEDKEPFHKPIAMPTCEREEVKSSNQKGSLKFSFHASSVSPSYHIDPHDVVFQSLDHRLLQSLSRTPHKKLKVRPEIRRSQKKLMSSQV